MLPKTDILSTEKQEITTVNLDSKIHGLFEVVTTLSDSKVYMIGSSVRRHLTHERNEFNDYDFVGVYNFDEIEASPLCKVISRHDKYGVMKVSIDGCDVDLIHNINIVDAISSRDITLSLLCMDETGKVVDPLGYFSDLENKIVRIEDPVKKIGSDPVRILRVLRFAVELEFQIDPATTDACISFADLLRGGTAKFEAPKIRKMNPEERSKLIDLARNLGIYDQLLSVFVNRGIEAIGKNTQLKNSIARLKDFLKTSNFYIYGGSLRDAALDSPISDIDVKLSTTPDELMALLNGNGYTETDDYHLPENTFFYNRKFNAISIRLEGMVYDFTFLENLDLESWYKNCDVNSNALMMDAASGVVLNSELLGKILIGVLELCDPNKEEMDPLKFANFLKQVAKIKGLILDPTSMSTITRNMPNIYKYFSENPRMLYRVKSIMGRENSSQVIDIIRALPQGEELLCLLEG